MQAFIYSTEGYALTKRFEGLRLKAYQDVGGVWTIGYGHVSIHVVRGLVWTQAIADAGLEADVATAVLCVNTAVKAAITQSKFDAMVDFCFNCGDQAFETSTLLRKLNLGDVAGAAAEFPKWCHDDGKVIDDLVKRRAAERLLFLR